MKKDIHPKNYRTVIFQDSSTGDQFLLNSTVPTAEKGTYEGKEYPLAKVEITSASHPFYTGEDSKILDTQGRVDRFKKRQAATTSRAKKAK